MSLTLLLLGLLGSWPVSLGEALVRAWHNYDLLRCDVTAEPRGDEGLAVRCLLTLRVERPGPMGFLLAGSVTGLRASESGAPIEATLGGEGLVRLVRAIAPGAGELPAVLTIAPREAAGERKILLEYLWKPSGDGISYADAQGVQTHLSGFWVPTMADEHFDASVRLPGGWEAACLARQERSEGWTRFESDRPVQVLGLVAGPFRLFERGRLSLLLPPSCAEDPEALLDDLSAVLARLEEWFGPAGEDSFRLVVEPRARPAPSYCAGAFAVVHGSRLPAAAGRLLWIDHLAHECAHRWWGHRVATPMLGGGGTWLREGLAQYAGIRVAGALVGQEAERRLWRANTRAYLESIDLRRAGDHLFANEATLLDATYLDDPVIAYCRGALVHRALEAHLGGAEFLLRLRRFSGGAGAGFVGAREYAELLGLPDLVAYYAGSTRLPDFALEEVEVAEGSARAVVRCLDPLWPGRAVSCRVEWEGGAADVAVALEKGVGRLRWTGAARPAHIEVDPERIHLDPVRSNGVWPR